MPGMLQLLKWKLTIDYKKIDNIEFDGIDYNDYLDFCDTYIVSADLNGVPMTEEEEELDELNEDGEFVHEKLFDFLFW